MNEELGQRRWEVKLLPSATALSNTVWIYFFYIEFLELKISLLMFLTRTY